MKYQLLFGLQYAFRIKTEAIFEQNKEHIFDFYILDDHKLEEFYLFKNIWRETMLLNSFDKNEQDGQRVNKVLSFGQLPNKIIYKEIQQIQCITLEDYFKHKEKDKDAIKESYQEETLQKEIEEFKDGESNLKKKNSVPPLNEPYLSQKTYFSEIEAINIILKLIDLLQVLHSRNILHTNFNPQEIHLANSSLDKLCFLSLYYCSWDTLNGIGIFLPEDGDNLSIYDTRVRNRNYISPEQIKLGDELE